MSSDEQIEIQRCHHGDWSLVDKMLTYVEVCPGMSNDVEGSLAAKPSEMCTRNVTEMEFPRVHTHVHDDVKMFRAGESSSTLNCRPRACHRPCGYLSAPQTSKALQGQLCAVSCSLSVVSCHGSLPEIKFEPPKRQTPVSQYARTTESCPLT